MYSGTYLEAVHIGPQCLELGPESIDGDPKMAAFRLEVGDPRRQSRKRRPLARTKIESVYCLHYKRRRRAD